MGAKLPKQFLSLSERPILMRTIEKFHVTLPDAKIILALGADYVEYWGELCRENNFSIPYYIVIGGDSRFESVRNCVDAIDPDTDYVLIHDGVRPFVSSDLIFRVVDGVKKFDAVVPAVEVVDSLRREISASTSEAIDRNGLKAVQTPQAFRFDILKKSYSVDFKSSFTDDASVVEFSGYSVAIVDGERSNIKITTKEDVDFANFFLKNVDN